MSTLFYPIFLFIALPFSLSIIDHSILYTLLILLFIIMLFILYDVIIRGDKSEISIYYRFIYCKKGL